MLSLITFCSVNQPDVDIIASVWFVAKVETHLEDKGGRVPANKRHLGGWQRKKQAFGGDLLCPGQAIAIWSEGSLGVVSCL